MNKIFSVVLFAVVLLVPGLSAAQTYVTQEVKVSNGWNLHGAVTGTPLFPWPTFGNLVDNDPTNGVWWNIGGLTENIVSVWKWNAEAYKWEFYSPRLDSTTMAGYAQNHGIGVLSVINPGEGFWILSKGETWMYQSGYLADDLITTWGLGGGVKNGWNLLAVPVGMTVEEFAGLFDQNPPAPGVIPGVDKIMSVWGWDSAAGKWKFYSPQMLQYYEPWYMDRFIAEKGYTHFTEPLQQGEAVWVYYQMYGGKG